MTARTVTLPGGRLATEVPADEAGEVVLSCADGLIQHLDAAGLLSWRQVTAAGELARLYGLGGGRSAWRRTGGGVREDDAVAAARREFAALLRQAPERCRWPLTVLAMGEWCVAADPVPLWREGLTAVADHLRLPVE